MCRLKFQCDVSNAFQNTNRDIVAYKKGGPPPKAVYCYQAAGFTETGPNGQRMCCLLLMVMQGAIDTSRWFGTALTKTLMERAGCRRSLWDNEAWEYPQGPLSASAASLEEILESVMTAECHNILFIPAGDPLFSRSAVWSWGPAPPSGAVCRAP